ncbi:hypothetical protein N9Y60_00225 [Crocinitomicaceae bacterium]|nr:hypothetical protein [Crocinitomicaceae bacterium]MDB3906786.1 hypothetical protein [Crocinitomicaceae bacterium]MDC0257913.1 hypothetical protein [Crocinitomicaceae bacterium]
MKKLLILPVLAMALFACNMASEEDYNNMAEDMCDCIEGSTKGMSDRGKQILGDSDGDATKLQQDLIAYMTEDPVGSAKDMEVMAAMETDMVECSDKLEKKYDDVYTSESEDEIMKKLMEAVNNLDDGCKISKAILNAGYEEMK